jgi:nucleoside-diphosphate-sugar epimerase
VAVVTGAAGWLGKNLVQALAGERERVRCLVHDAEQAPLLDLFHHRHIAAGGRQREDGGGAACAHRSPARRRRASLGASSSNNSGHVLVLGELDDCSSRT